MRISPSFYLTAAMGLALTSGPVTAEGLPTGGQIMSGSGSISQAGNAMTITQGSNNLVTNWQSFSIGQGSSVTFQQPSANSVALNRVLGSDVSVIQGALTANGKVFLINPNGVTFTPTAQVNTGGIVASTLGMKTEDFLSGNYKFEGDSSNAIVNQGNIQAANGGTIALIAAKIVNEGNLTAQSGNVLLGAGRKVTLDLGGPVKLEVEEGALNTLIEQGGAIRAAGGHILLTAKAAGMLATSVINHTGVTEAQTLATGQTGEIELLGDMAVGVANISGKLDASAPTGGNGGFIDTSAAKVNVADNTAVTTKSSTGEDGLWLIDPNDYLVAASGGNITGATLSSNLGGGNVQIATTGAGGNLTINDPVNWAQHTLTLHANNNIIINQNLTATGTGGLAFEYGQDTTTGTGSSYNVASGAHVFIPSASNFTWKKGSSGVTNNLWFGNNALAISSNKSAALNANGALIQPFYYDDGTQSRSAGWYKLTFSNYPLDFALGTGGTGTNSWNNTGQILSTNTGGGLSDVGTAINSLSIDLAGYKEGIGTLTTKLNVNVAETGSTANIVNAYTLEADKNFIRTETSVENKSTTANLSNVRLWIGTRDDYVGGSDSNYKTKGNLSNGFDEITNQADEAKALKITEQINGTGAAILFYSTSDGANTVTDSCCSFSNVVNKNPIASDIQTPQEDGSYALYMRMADLTPNQSAGLVWYYGAGQANHIDTIISQVAQASGAAPRPVVNNEVPRQNAVAAAQSTAASTVLATQPLVSTFLQPTPNAVGNMSQGGPRTNLTVGSMDVVQLSSADMANLQSRTDSSGSSGSSQSNAGQVGTQADLFGPTRVFVVDGGVRLPASDAKDEKTGG